MKKFITTVTCGWDSNFSPSYVAELFARFRNRGIHDATLTMPRLIQVFLTYLIFRSLSLAFRPYDEVLEIVVVTSITALSCLSLLAYSILLMKPSHGWEDPFLDQCSGIELRRMARTLTERLALVPAGSCVGDMIALCKGGSVPLVLRRHPDGFQLIGESYVHGVMNGEAFVEEQCKILCVV
jgi:hypothetical protein